MAPVATQSSPRPARLAGFGLQRGAFAAAWLCVACGVSPRPEPPVTLPPPPTLDESRLSYRVPGDGEAPEAHVVIVGSADAVNTADCAEAPGCVVRAFNLDDTSPPVDAAVADDGSFELELGAEEGNTVRLEGIGPTAASGPEDLTLGRDGSLESLDAPLGDCLELNPRGLMWLERQAEGKLEVANSCERAIELVEPRARSSRDRLELGQDQSWPLTLEVNGLISIRIEATDGEPGDEYVFFVEATAPEKDRRAVSVRLE